MAAANLTKANPQVVASSIRTSDMLPLAADVVLYPGSKVGWNTTSGASKGYLVKFDQASANNGIVLLGRYWPTINISATADSTGLAQGAIKVEVEFFKPHYLMWWDNDSVHTCVVADRGSPAYAESDHEAGNTAGSLSRVGTVYAVGAAAEGTGGGVLVDITGQV